MTTYADVLLKKELIIDFVKQFGYSDEVKIRYDVPEEGSDKFQLTFIVEEIQRKPVPHKMVGLLEAKLSAELGFVASVIDYAYIPELYRYNTDIKSASITDERGIKKAIYRVNNELYEKKIIEVDESELDKINFADFALKPIDEMIEYDRFFYEILLKQAEEYLRKKAEQQSESARSSAASGASVQDEKHSDSSGESPPQSARSSGDTYNELRNKKRTKEASDPTSQEKREKTGDDPDRETSITPVEGSTVGKNM